MGADSNGPVVLRGHIRVDYAKAAVKLSDHLLVDRETYLVELLRVAVLSNAKGFALNHDADDLYAEFDGDPIDAMALSDLFTHLVRDTGDRRMRLLAIAVGAAAAATGGAVEIFARAADGSFASRRYEARDPGTAREARSHPKDGRDVRGFCMHVERPLGLAVAGALLTRGEPREIGHLRARASHAPVSITVGARPLSHEPEPVLLSVPMRDEDTPADVTIAVEFLRRRAAPPSIVFRELGVSLVESSFLPEPWLRRSELRSAPPLRIAVDGFELPTNASRSQVHETFATEVVAAVKRFLPDAVMRLRAELDVARRAHADAVRTVELEDALGAIAAHVMLAFRAEGSLARALAFTLDVPLLADGCGAPRTMTEIAATLGELHAREATAPLGAELAHLAPEVLWLRGRAAEEPFASLPSWERIEREAEHGGKARARSMARPAQRPTVPESADDVARTRIRNPSGIAGEMSLRNPRVKRRHWATLRIHVDQRLLEIIHLTAAEMPLPVDTAIEWPGRLKASLGYDRVRRDQRYREALALVSRAAAGLLAKAIHLSNERPNEELRLLAGFALEAGDTSAALQSTPLVPTTEGTLVSVETLRGYAARTGALCSVSAKPRTPTRAPDGRPVVVLDTLASSMLVRRALPAGARLVEYDRYLERGPATAETMLDHLERQRGLGPGLSFSTIGIDGSHIVATPSPTSALVRLHHGHVVHASEGHRPGLLVVSEEPALVPRTDVELPPLSPSVEEVGSMLALAALERTLGQAISEPGVRCEGNVDVPLVRSWVLACVLRDRLPARHRPTARRAPLFRMLDASSNLRNVSTEEIESAHETRVPRLGAPPEFPTGAWQPVIASEDELRALRKLAVRPVYDAAKELDARRAAAATAATRERVLAQPTFTGDPTDLHPLSPIVAIDLGPRHVKARIGLRAPRDGAISERGMVRALYRGRLLTDVEGPPGTGALTGIVDFEGEDAFGVTFGVTAAESSAIEAVLRDATRTLADAVLASGREAGLGDACVTEFLAAVAPSNRGIFSRASVLVATVQGDHVALSRIVQGRGITTGLMVGREAHAPWPKAKRSTDLDKPILFVAPGSAGDALLTALASTGITIRDVSEQIAAYVARNRAGTSAAPMLPGVPPHPSLRVGVDRIFPRGDGQIEIVAGPRSQLTLVDATGGHHDAASLGLALESVCPFRAVVRPDFWPADPVAMQPFVRELLLALKGYFQVLVTNVERLPPFYRAHLRAYVARAARAATVPPALQQMKLFPDLAGGLHSLHDIATREPPWLSVGPETTEAHEAALVLTIEEFDHLAGVVPLRFLAPDLGLLAATCLVTARVDGPPGVHVGALRASSSAARGIVLRRRGRRVATLSDGPGVPLAAVVDDPTLDLAPWRGQPPMAVIADIQQLVRNAFRDSLARGEGATVIEDRFADLHVVGRIESVAAPPARVVCHTSWSDADVEVAPRSSVPRFGIERPLLPCSGELFVSTTGGRVITDLEPLVERVVLRALGALVAASLPAETRWYAYLVAGERLSGAGSRATTGLEARTIDGQRVQPERVRVELEREGVLLRARAAASRAPLKRVVLTFAQPLTAALTTFAPSWLADLSAEETGVLAIEEAPEPLAPSPSQHTVPGRELAPSDPDGMEAGEAAAAADGFFHRIAKAMHDLVARDPGESAKNDDPILVAMGPTLLRIPRLARTGLPELRYRSTGRAVRYRPVKGAGVVEVGTRDASLAALQARGDHLSLAAGVLAEINRELDDVSDVEEARALTALLEGL